MLSPDILARHPSGDWFVMRGVGCVRTPVARFATKDHALAWDGLQS